MAINKKLIHFKSKQKFNEELANGNILETSIVFIQDTTEIYTHGQLYDGSTFDSSDIEASIQNIIDNYATKTEIPTKVSQLDNDSYFVTDTQTIAIDWDEQELTQSQIKNTLRKLEISSKYAMEFPRPKKGELYDKEVKLLLKNGYVVEYDNPDMPLYEKEDITGILITGAPSDMLEMYGNTGGSDAVGIVIGLDWWYDEYESYLGGSNLIDITHYVDEGDSMMYHTGFEQTKRLFNDITSTPVVDYCVNYSCGCKTRGQWYVPSYLELEFIPWDQVIEIMTNLGITINQNIPIWSSSYWSEADHEFYMYSLNGEDSGFLYSEGTPGYAVPVANYYTTLESGVQEAWLGVQTLINDLPTKVSELENDVPYIVDDVVPDGVYAVDANGKLIDYNTADATATGVALVAGEHKFMIAKSDATNDGSNYNFYYDYDKGDLSLTNYSNADGTNNHGYLGGSSTPQLSQDFTTWTAGALSDFNGKSNTQVIAASSSNAKDMCKVLETFNAGSDNQGHSDWYVPAAGQLALMYLAKTDINAALAKIGGTALAAGGLWSSSEYSSSIAWCVYFINGSVRNDNKDFNRRVRFVRDISVSKSLKERVSDLESKITQLNAVLVDTEGEADDPENIDEIIQSDWNETDFTSGAYIKNKPTIPSESTVSEWGFTKNTGTYSKPSTGIPKSDLASEIQTSLGKADTALQSYTEQYKGTITGVSANGTSVATSGVANIPAASTSKYGVTKLSSATNSTSTTLAATASAVKSAYDLANGKQAKLVSGTNIKTINGASVLGSGNLEIGGSSAYPRVDHGATNTTFSLSPNTFYVWDEVASLNLSFTSGNESVANEYTFQFVSGGIPATLSLPDGIQWIGGEPNLEANKTYQVSILNGIGVIASVGAPVRMIQFTIERYIAGPTTYSCENGMTWKQWVDSEYNTLGWEDAGNTIYLSFDYVLDIYIDDVIIEGHTYTCEYND